MKKSNKLSRKIGKHRHVSHNTVTKSRILTGKPRHWSLKGIL